MNQALMWFPDIPKLPRVTWRDANLVSPVFTAHVRNEKTLNMAKKPVTANSYFFNYLTFTFFKAMFACCPIMDIKRLCGAWLFQVSAIEARVWPSNGTNSVGMCPQHNSISMLTGNRTGLKKNYNCLSEKWEASYMMELSVLYTLLSLVEKITFSPKLLSFPMLSGGDI